MKKKLSLILLILFTIYKSQSVLTVYQSGNEIPVAGAAVTCNGTVLGYTQNNGTLSFTTDCLQVEVSKDGYYTEKPVTDAVMQVYLAKTDLKTQNIETVIINESSDPRALAILKKVRENYKNNSPKSLDSYRYKSYEKISIDIDEDSLQHYNQSLSEMTRLMDRLSLKKKDKKQEEDTTVTVKEVFANSKLFLWERAQEFLHSSKYGEKINVLDNRVAGLSEPFYEMMAIQSNRDRMPREIREENQNLYRYFLTDSIEIEGRQNYVISFREVTYKQAVQRRKFNGYLYVDTETYGLRKIESHNKEKSDGSMTSIWKPLYGKWFLESESIKMKLTNMSMEPDQDNSADEQDPERRQTMRTVDNFRTYGMITATYFDHESPIEETPKDFRGYTFSVKNADGSLMDQYRTENLTPREQNTYVVIDSLGQKMDINSKASVLSALVRGKVRVNKVDIDLGKVIGYNLYEGARAGISVKLNEKFSPVFSPDAYFAYGFKDGDVKYGVGADYHLSRNRTAILRGEYYHDVMAAGRFSEHFWDFRMKINNAGIALNNDRFYHFEGGKITFEYDLTNNLSMKLAGILQTEEARFNYTYRNAIADFTNFSTLLSFKYSPFSRNMMTPQGKFTTRKRYPEFFLNFEQAWEGLGGDFKYSKADVLINHQFKTKLGLTGIRVYGGKLFGEAPMWHHFTMNGLSGSNNFKFNLTSYLGFATMKGGMYYNDEFVGQYFTHRIPWYFRSIGQNSSSFDIIHRSVIGNMRNPEYHQFNFRKLDHLYQEVGLEWNNFLSSYFNLGLFYRVGYYHTPKFSDNFAVQLKFKLLAF